MWLVQFSLPLSSCFFLFCLNSWLVKKNCNSLETVQHNHLKTLWVSVRLKEQILSEGFSHPPRKKQNNCFHGDVCLMTSVVCECVCEGNKKQHSQCFDTQPPQMKVLAYLQMRSFHCSERNWLHGLSNSIDFFPWPVSLCLVVALAIHLRTEWGY